MIREDHFLLATNQILPILLCHSPAPKRIVFPFLQVALSSAFRCVSHTPSMSHNVLPTSWKGIVNGFIPTATYSCRYMSRGRVHSEEAAWRNMSFLAASAFRMPVQKTQGTKAQITVKGMEFVKGDEKFLSSSIHRPVSYLKLHYYLNFSRKPGKPNRHKVRGDPPSSPAPLPGTLLRVCVMTDKKLE